MIIENKQQSGDILDTQKFKYIYGPVFSWRLGMSLGIDPLSDKSKVCNLDCIYCQLGRTGELTVERKDYVPVEAIIDEFRLLPAVEIDHLTFSGRGEPTLAKNLGKMILALRAIRQEKIAVITNSILLADRAVQDDLAPADVVSAKLDACNQDTFVTVGRAVGGAQFQDIVQGIREFRRRFSGKLALQVMFVEANKKYAAEIAGLIQDIGADEIELNTPLRPSFAKPLSENEMAEIKQAFSGLPARTVYELERQEALAFDERATMRRHGNYKKR